MTALAMVRRPSTSFKCAPMEECLRRAPARTCTTATRHYCHLGLPPLGFTAAGWPALMRTRKPYALLAFPDERHLPRSVADKTYLRTTTCLSVS